MKKKDFKVDVEGHFSKHSKNYYADAHNSLSEAYNNVGKALNEILYGTVLDIGNGGVFFYDTDRLEKIIAVDLAYPEKMQNTEKTTFYLADGRDLTLLQDQKVDCVLMQFLLHHVVEGNLKQTDEALKKMISEAHRVLKPNGRLVIVEAVVLPCIELFENIFYGLNSYILGLINKPMVKFYCKSSLISCMEKVGYSNIESQKIPLGKKWISPAAALFPGKFVIPPWLFPTRFCCITASKSCNEPAEIK